MSATAKLEDRIRVLQKRRAHYIGHTYSCIESDDWHGVQDAASDIRDIESELKALEWVLAGPA